MTATLNTSGLTRPYGARTGSGMRAHPLTAALGAEVTDVDLAEVSRSDELFG